MVTVRRFLTFVLLVVFGSAGIAPLLANAAVPASRLPLCCRQGGAHHCMAMAAIEGGQPVARMACPMLPQWLAPLPNQTVYKASAPNLGASDAVWPSPNASAVEEARSRWLEARASRGPPQG